MTASAVLIQIPSGAKLLTISKDIRLSMIDVGINVVNLKDLNFPPKFYEENGWCLVGQGEILDEK